MCGAGLNEVAMDLAEVVDSLAPAQKEGLEVAPDGEKIRWTQHGVGGKDRARSSLH